MIWCLGFKEVLVGVQTGGTDLRMLSSPWTISDSSQAEKRKAASLKEAGPPITSALKVNTGCVSTYQKL